jgi:type II secretory pathway component PulM
LRSPSLSGSGLAPRDRRALQWGAAAACVVVLVALLLPYVRVWRDREALISARHDELARLRGLQASAPSLRAIADRLEARAGTYPQRPVAASTAALAAGVLQQVLQRYADDCQLSVSELNVSGEPDSTAVPLGGVPATIIALGDVYGVSEFLARVQEGATLLEVRELSIQVNPARRADGGGELLQVTLAVRAPFVIE